MNGEIFDNVKYEKAKAIARFKLLRRIKKLWKVLVVVLLVAWTLKKTPAAVKFSGEVLVTVSFYVFNPHVVFLIGNAIIVALFVLCRKTGVGSDSGDRDGDVYDDYVRHSAVPESELVMEEEVEVEKSVVEFHRGGVVEEMQIAAAVAEEAKCEEVETVIAKATKQIRRFERTQSEKLRREIGVSPRRELRRSETEMRRFVNSSGEITKKVMPSVETVETLSNEEFKLAIDAFINKHRGFIYEQKMRELKQLKSV